MFSFSWLDQFLGAIFNSFFGGVIVPSNGSFVKEPHSYVYGLGRPGLYYIQEKAKACNLDDYIIE